jgi:hypothetical protein
MLTTPPLARSSAGAERVTDADAMPPESSSLAACVTVIVPTRSLSASAAERFTRSLPLAILSGAESPMRSTFGATLFTCNQSVPEFRFTADDERMLPLPRKKMPPPWSSMCVAPV